jgi:hypothetical protein
LKHNVSVQRCDSLEGLALKPEQRFEVTQRDSGARTWVSWEDQLCSGVWRRLTEPCGKLLLTYPAFSYHTTPCRAVAACGDETVRDERERLGWRKRCGATGVWASMRLALSHV